MGYISLVGTDLYADRVMAIHDSWHLSVGWNVKIRKQKKNGHKTNFTHLQSVSSG
jgi:hypothetical protein